MGDDRGVVSEPLPNHIVRVARDWPRWMWTVLYYDPGPDGQVASMSFGYAWTHRGADKAAQAFVDTLLK